MKTDLIIQNAPFLNTNGDQSKLLYQVNTLKLSEDSPAGGTDFTGVGAVNIFGGTPTQGPRVIINAATLVNNQVITFVNTSLRLAALRLTNGGNVGSSTVYILQPGQATFQFDGTNLN
jgi:hypothetical protein